jgi:hypothetical protein
MHDVVQAFLPRRAVVDDELDIWARGVYGEGMCVGVDGREGRGERVSECVNVRSTVRVVLGRVGTWQ